MTTDYIAKDYQLRDGKKRFNLTLDQYESQIADIIATEKSLSKPQYLRQINNQYEPGTTRTQFIRATIAKDILTLIKKLQADLKDFQTEPDYIPPISLNTPHNQQTTTEHQGKPPQQRKPKRPTKTPINTKLHTRNGRASNGIEKRVNIAKKHPGGDRTLVRAYD